MGITIMLVTYGIKHNLTSVHNSKDNLIVLKIHFSCGRYYEDISFCNPLFSRKINTMMKDVSWDLTITVNTKYGYYSVGKVLNRYMVI